MMNIDAATVIARLAHAGQTYNGEPYIEHVLRVVRRLDGDPESTYGDAVLAVLHDTVEDTPLTFSDLWVLGYDTADLRVIPRRKPDSYEADIEKVVQGSPSVRRVKIADLKENLSQSGKPHLAARYRKALRKLHAAGGSR